jgi:chemotaxis signal transduction protein
MRATAAVSENAAVSDSTLASPGARHAEGSTERTDVSGALLFWAGGKLYSSPLRTLREALPVVPAFTPLPFSPPWLFGVFPLRTDLVTLIDPRLFLGEPVEEPAPGGAATPLDHKQALLIGDSGWLMALLVDRIGDIVNAERGAPDERDNAISRDLASLYIDVVAQLEVWARNV